MTLVKLYQNFKCATILVSQITLGKQQRIADFFFFAQAQEYLHKIKI